MLLDGINFEPKRLITKLQTPLITTKTVAFNPVVFFSRRLALADKLTVYTSRWRRPSQSRS
jgi:hypothetical protein